MILTLDNLEASALTLHMAIMRKSMRNLLKKKYPKEKKDFLESYDFIHEEAKKVLITSDTDSANNYDINANIRDLTVLNEFLKAYTQKIEELDTDLQGEDQEQIEVLVKLHRKCEEVVGNV